MPLLHTKIVVASYVFFSTYFTIYVCTIFFGGDSVIHTVYIIIAYIYLCVLYDFML